METGISATFDLFDQFEKFLDENESRCDDNGDHEVALTIPLQIDIIVKKKRTRKKKAPAVPALKMVKNDIRRSYPNLLINVMNSCDFSLLYGLLDTFFVPDFVQNLYCTYQEGYDGISNHELTLNGLFGVAHHWFTSFLLFPDAAATLLNTEINVHAGKIVASMSFTASIVYDQAQAIRTLCDNSNRDIATQRASALNDDSKSTIKALLDSICGTINALTPMLQPKAVEAKGTITLHTNEEKQITSIEWKWIEWLV